MQKTLSKKERSEIFKLFLNNNRLKFNEIEKCLKIRSNMVSYHLTSMVKDGLLVKKGEYYHLTTHAEKYIPIFSDIFGMDIGPIPVILIAVIYKNKILLVKRNKRPYKDYWSMIGGKILLHESLSEASVRKVLEKTGLDSEFVSLNSMLHERIEGSGDVKHSFILLFTKVSVKDEMHIKLKESNVGVLRWFNIDSVDNYKDEIIPSDYWLIKHSLNKKIKIPQLYMHENDGIISSHKFLK